MREASLSLSSESSSSKTSTHGSRSDDSREREERPCSKRARHASPVHTPLDRARSPCGASSEGAQRDSQDRQRTDTSLPSSDRSRSSESGVLLRTLLTDAATVAAIKNSREKLLSFVVGGPPSK
jgi:hypothetical protein